MSARIHDRRLYQGIVRDREHRTGWRIGDTVHSVGEATWVAVFWLLLFVLPGIAGLSAYFVVADAVVSLPTYIRAVLMVGSGAVAATATVAVMLGIAWLADTPQAGDGHE